MKLTDDDFAIHDYSDTESYYYISQKNPIQVIKQILENQEKAEKWDLYLEKGSASESFLEQENKQLKEDKEKIVIDNCILSDFKTDIEAQVYMSGADSVDDLSYKYNENKEIVEKIQKHTEWMIRDITAAKINKESVVTIKLLTYHTSKLKELLAEKKTKAGELNDD